MRFIVRLDSPNPEKIVLFEQVQQRINSSPQLLGHKADAYTLVVTDTLVELRSLQRPLRPYFVDFENSQLQRRSIKQNIKQEALIQAIGLNAGLPLHILDATAGFGTDAFLLAQAGCDVIAIEESPIVFSLVEDGWRRYCAANQPLSLQFLNQNTLDWMRLGHATGIDVVYIDPMFPVRKKTVQPNRQMQMLQDIVCAPRDTETLFKLARQIAQKRVVVKRPRLAESLAKTEPTFSRIGKSTRFDVYLAS